eukprot:1790384-Prymnesium_polylepis.2
MSDADPSTIACGSGVAGLRLRSGWPDGGRIDHRLMRTHGAVWRAAHPPVDPLCWLPPCAPRCGARRPHKRRPLAAHARVRTCLYASVAFASAVAMNGLPMYAKSAPAARAASTARPVPIDPDSARGPSKNCRISSTSAKGERPPACPPAPAATAISPSAPFSSCAARGGASHVGAGGEGHVCARARRPARRGKCRTRMRPAWRRGAGRGLTALAANLVLITSWYTCPPYECTAALTSSRAPSDVMTRGTSCRTHASRSCSRRSLDLCTIWLTANGAAGRSGFSASCFASSVLICVSHSSSLSFGRALSAGKEPTMPALHWAITSSGLDTMKSGACGERRGRGERPGGGGAAATETNSRGGGRAGEAYSRGGRSWVGVSRAALTPMIGTRMRLSSEVVAGGMVVCRFVSAPSSAKIDETFITPVVTSASGGLARPIQLSGPRPS